ncbi:RDD family protein [Polaribacter vadi]|uniref:RDD family protein n=1 Tax=Polaribacter TaxID=52959 RepID=UPI001C09F62C|nr:MULTISPECIES: RDD family protein [Polaribacter]MBU3011679.1 RDD family protein [Polaribacter vadi]MDO6741492.1 RDD family protein [Polaribacter sp. 1_MG-2023]
MSGLEEFDNYHAKFEKASIGRRIVASVIDFIIYYFVCVFLALVLDNSSESIFSFHLEGFSALVAFLVGFFLWPISEGIWGQTIGKRFIDIKVVSKDYLDVNMGQAFGRFVLGFIDCSFISGIIVAIINKDNQRIGDMAAGTFVINSKYKE